ncbi:MAG: CHAT domain-containing protein [Rubrivivax sp.]
MPFHHPWRRTLGAFCLLALLAGPAPAQDEGGPEVDAAALPTDRAPSTLSAEQARRQLEEPAPADPGARYAWLQRQEAAAWRLAQRQRQIEVLRELVEASKGRPERDTYVLDLFRNDFSYGSQARAMELADRAVADTSIGLHMRALIGLVQTEYWKQLQDRIRTERAWSTAQSLQRQALASPGPVPAHYLRSMGSIAESAVAHMRGDRNTSIEHLRESSRRAKAWMDERAAFHKPPAAPDAQWLQAWTVRDWAQGLAIWELAALGRFAEAAAICDSGLARARESGSTTFIAQWSYRSAHAQLQLRQYERAQKHAAEAESLLASFGASRASRQSWLARETRILALVGQRRWAEADDSYNEFLASIPGDQLAASSATNARLQALLAAKAGRVGGALERIESHVRFRGRLYGESHPLTREAKGVRGVIQLIAGNKLRAMSDYEDLFGALLDNPSGWVDLAPAGARGFYLDIALEEFLRHVYDTRRGGAEVEPRLVERALQVADRLSLGVTHEALVDSMARVRAGNPALREALEAEQQQRSRLRSAYAELNAAQSQWPNSREKEKEMGEEAKKALAARIKQLREAADQQQVDLKRLRDDVARRFPAYADLVTPPIPDAKTLQSLLRPGEALLEVQGLEFGTLAWLVTPSGRIAMTASERSAADQQRWAKAARAWLDAGSNPAALTQPPPLVLHDIWRELLAPFEPALKDVKHLIVATPGPLAALPFAAVLTDAPAASGPQAWLLKRMSVTQLPANSALQALRRGAPPAPAAQALIGFGDPAFDLAKAEAPNAKVRRLALAGGQRNLTSYDADEGFRYADMPPLPETRQELGALAAALGADPARDLVLGAQATRQAVMSADLKSRRVVAFATHGLMPGELPGISKPALALAATADPNESPLLQLDDVLDLKLNAQWVVLSACNTAAGEAGGAAMSGLVRGFFFAGTRSVLATHWAVESESAAALVSGTFRAAAQAKADAPRAAALREAQLAMAEGRAGGGAWTHPFFWAPYALFGDPAR